MRSALASRSRHGGRSIACLNDSGPTAAVLRAGRRKAIVGADGHHKAAATAAAESREAANRAVELAGASG